MTIGSESEMMKGAHNSFADDLSSPSEMGTKVRTKGFDSSGNA
ncbi:hypothetical protein PMI30_05082 [Pseudomonas sp. GM50]|nr:hypothetical protein PMI30_05082 [Pseudomonas sp. GM50]